MKITDKILSIPPYISTAWKNILSLRMEGRPFGHALVIELVTGNTVDIPNLDRSLIEKIFSIHAHTVEEELQQKNGSLITTPLPFSFPSLEGMIPMLGHNPDQKDSPLLPPEMLEKIARMAKSLLPDDPSSLAQPQPGCDCPHCQIMRAILADFQESAAAAEEPVSDDDLSFRGWDIQQEGDRLYAVTNPLDQKEQYHVFLGEPIGCTCGQKTCEHIQAVLKS